MESIDRRVRVIALNADDVQDDGDRNRDRKLGSQLEAFRGHSQRRHVD
jgi:hypothetical protein